MSNLRLVRPRNERGCVRAAVLALSGLSIAAPSKAWAQAEDGTLEEIVVTAQKREQSAQDVGISVAVFSGEDLASLNVEDVPDIAANITNVQINHGAGQNAFNVRGLGINEFSTNLDSPVAVHVDEVYISKNFMTTLLLFDIERVEALKGPQGTLFGRNTTGGAVNFYSRRPSDTFAAAVSLGYDNYETVRTEGYVSGPLGGGFSARLSGFFEDQSQGYYRNVTRREEEGKLRKSAVRGQLAWQGEATRLLLSLHAGEDRSLLIPFEGVGVVTPASFAAGAPALCAEYLNGTVTGATPGCVRGTDGLNDGDNDPFTSHNDLSHRADNRSGSGMLRLDHEFDGATLTAISGFEDFERNSREDTDGSPTPNLDVFWYQDIAQYSQEIRLTSSGDRRWNYILGGYYEHDELETADFARFGGGALGFLTRFDQDVDAAAVFFHNDLALNDEVSLIAGARYTQERIEIDGGTFVGTGQTSSDGIEQPASIIAPASLSSLLPQGNRRDDDDVSFKLGLEWQPILAGGPIDDLMLYVSGSTGFRSGGFNASFALTQEGFTSIQPENITAYEAGVKSLMARRSLQLNGAVFQYDFRDGVVNIDRAGSPVPVAVNAANIDIWGAEADLRWRPVAGLDFTSGVGWLDAQIKSDAVSAGTSLKGNSPVNSPEWNYNGQIRYEAAASDALRFAIQANANWRSSQYLETVNEPASREDAYWIVNASATLLGREDRWSISLWGRNLTDTRYRSYVNDLAGFGFLLNIYGAPRTYGVTASARF